MYVCMYVCMHACMHVCMYVWHIYIYIHTLHTHTHTYIYIYIYSCFPLFVLVVCLSPKFLKMCDAGCSLTLLLLLLLCWWRSQGFLQSKLLSWPFIPVSVAGGCTCLLFASLLSLELDYSVCRSRLASACVLFWGAWGCQGRSLEPNWQSDTRERLLKTRHDTLAVADMRICLAKGQEDLTNGGPLRLDVLKRCDR